MFSQVIRYIVDPSFILVGALLISLAGRYIFKLTYINCFDIIKQHILCFKKNDGKISKVTVAIYFGVPILLAIAVSKIKIIDDDAINIITIIVSILTSMFFTLLTLTIDLREKVKGNSQYTASEASISAQLLKETYYSVMFEILISVLILIMCFVNIFTNNFTIAGSFIIYLLVFTLLTNLFMILKRIFKVIDRNMNV